MESFKEIIGGKEPVLVDFYATWCGPCKMMHPTIDELSNDFEGKMRILKVDIDKNNAAANKYKIQAVPTFILFREGEIKWRNSGVMDKQALTNAINPFIKS